jgi:hypothetical protein
VSDGGRVPPGIDATVATAARMYDYWLGGHDNFAADRIAAHKLTEHAPDVPALARENRKFLGRTVRFLVAEAGIHQFLDLGTGLPTKGNVHEVAQAITPAARVVYVDNDPMVLAHSRALKTSANTAVINADLRDADIILTHPATQQLLDFSQPLAVLFASVLHFVGGGAAHEAVAQYVGVTAPGSYLVLSHAATDPDPAAAEAGMAVYASTTNPSTLRTRDQILAFFDGMEILEPGLVPVQQWRPEEPPPSGISKSWILGAVGRIKPGRAQMPLPVSTVPTPVSAVTGQSSGDTVAEESGAVLDRPAPAGIDPTVATAARMYDYWLGGHENFAADRQAALKIADLWPDAPLVARANRQFLGRVVRYIAAEAGIRQFLDLGTGLPTGGSVHQVAQAIDPSCRVVYVDNDPMVLAHARALKTGQGTAVIRADLRDTDIIFSHPDTRRLIDFSQPLAVLFVAVLHFIGDDAYETVVKYASAAAAGSYLALSHVCSDQEAEEKKAAGTAVYSQTANPVSARSRAEILRFFGDWGIVEPGLIPVTQWHPDDSGSEFVGEHLVGGVAWRST